MFDNLNNPCLRMTSIFTVFIISIVHTVFAFLIKKNYFNTYDLFDSSPLFDFSLSDDCQSKEKYVLNQWGGRLKFKTGFDDDWNFDTRLAPSEETNITKINKKYFCYKHISYKDLLYNGQIIKKGAECPSEYKKNCGRIDTLEQELCIKEIDNCPLYDLGIGPQTDLVNYIYDEKSNVYYNNNNYNKAPKTIIGRLVLSDGQPCYNSTEKLWRKFDKEEAFDTHLKCEFEVFGEYNEKSSEKRGDITYKTLYIDNLNSQCKDLVLDNIKGDETVSLYRREFYGIDKECDSKFHLDENTYKVFRSSEKSMYLLLCLEGIVVLILSFIYMLYELIICCLGEKDKLPWFVHTIFFSIYTAFLVCCFICHVVYYYRVNYYNISDYNCSDSITNEIIRKGTEFIKPNVTYISVGFYLDLFLLGSNCLLILIGIISKIFTKEPLPKPKRDKNELRKELLY